nr:immunoglobulin light chain junction region [Macaca mulatta]MOV78433.1 immunoglobulin light chain junction region [Macaca mulatta]MOV78877.1 immunoglobulin light chain junction region [Macaca mulatta]MOV78927.1 immunoglobulin light chain junction region [Macaca mulatta]MOV79941.1 immunoglobulin light chain junction region [Macaca mulatta]
CLHYNSDPWTF